jgi:hypothetical protein
MLRGHLIGPKMDNIVRVSLQFVRERGTLYVYLPVYKSSEWTLREVSEPEDLPWVTTTQWPHYPSQLFAAQVSDVKIADEEEPHSKVWLSWTDGDKHVLRLPRGPLKLGAYWDLVSEAPGVPPEVLKVIAVSPLG